MGANVDGMRFLRGGKLPQAFEKLKHAEKVLVRNPDESVDDIELVALTCSNLGCYYRKVGLPRASLHYLERALCAERMHEPTGSEEDALSRAATKLNTCAALSQVGDHLAAERMAMQAAELVAGSGGPTAERCSLLAVACYNLGAVREHLALWDGAAAAYRQGSEAAVKGIGVDAALTRALISCADKALGKAAAHPTTPDRPARPASADRASSRRRPLSSRVGSRSRPSSGVRSSSARRPEAPRQQQYSQQHAAPPSETAPRPSALTKVKQVVAAQASLAAWRQQPSQNCNGEDLQRQPARWAAAAEDLMATSRAATAMSPAPSKASPARTAHGVSPAAGEVSSAAKNGKKDVPAGVVKKGVIIGSQGSPGGKRKGVGFDTTPKREWTVSPEPQRDLWALDSWR